jgi:hypothetical protein
MEASANLDSLAAARQSPLPKALDLTKRGLFASPGNSLGAQLDPALSGAKQAARTSMSKAFAPFWR